MNMRSRTRRVLEELQNVHSDLLAISDDIWLSIDHNDAESMQAGVAFKQQYNEKMAHFRQLEQDLTELLEHYLAQRNLPISNQAAELPDRLTTPVEEHHNQQPTPLDTQVPHFLDEDFTYKRPYGYTLRSRSVTELNSWRAIYESLLTHLAELNPELFASLLDHPEIISNRGNASVSRRPSDLRRPHQIINGFYVETNYSANQFKDSLRRILPLLNIQLNELKLYLQEDRDPEP